VRVLRGDGPAVLQMERRILLISGLGDRTEQMKLRTQNFSLEAP
jgi:hypothetical protein